ncbi:hypothetical protein [uncultured Sneathia sp.]|jgi:hypothetical protein|uniref:hypothetical protein n=1 Tax=uncultured Sneathia sp. TaxID=278067 RepID=UPI00259885AD|nr:hypothetical protein [uncultured Sneathia sp.]
MKSIKSNRNYVDIEIVPIDENYSLVKILKNELYKKNKVYDFENEHLSLIINGKETINLINQQRTLILGIEPIVIESYYNIELLKLIDKLNDYQNEKE